jgi:hypothetical protein
MVIRMESGMIEAIYSRVEDGNEITVIDENGDGLADSRMFLPQDKAKRQQTRLEDVTHRFTKRKRLGPLPKVNPTLLSRRPNPAGAFDPAGLKHEATLFRGGGSGRLRCRGVSYVALGLNSPELGKRGRPVLEEFGSFSAVSCVDV